MIRSRNIIATPPGATIREQLDGRGMRQNEFAKRMGMSEKQISQLINGEVGLTHEVALKLEAVLGVPAGVWNSLEAIFREKEARAAAENEMDEEIILSKKYPYNDMAKFGWVPAASKATEKVENLRRFFEVALLSCIVSLNIPGIACRQTGGNDGSDYALAAWAQQARIEARKIETSPMNLIKAGKLLNSFREMTKQGPSVFAPKLAEALASCGIAIAFLPHIGGSYLHGAAFRDGGRIVLGLTVRGKDADKFWFSFFHELGHILLKHVASGCEITKEQEQEADDFARDALIAPDKFRAYVIQGSFTREAVTAFSESCSIHPGIVVGRLQKERHIRYDQLNDLKLKYRITA